MKRSDIIDQNCLLVNYIFYTLTKNNEDNIHWNTQYCTNGTRLIRDCPKGCYSLVNIVPETFWRDELH